MHINTLPYSALCALALIPGLVLGMNADRVDAYPIDQRPALVYQNCMKDLNMTTHYDCACLKEKYQAELQAELEKPEQAAPETLEETVGQLQSGTGPGSRDTRTHSLLVRVMRRKACRDGQAFARHTRKECEARFNLMFLPPNVQKEAFCTCYGDKVAELFANDPDGRRAQSGSGQNYYSMKANQACRGGPPGGRQIAPCLFRWNL